MPQRETANLHGPESHKFMMQMSVPKGNKQGLECLHFPEGGTFHSPVWNSSSFFIKPTIVDMGLKYAALACW